MRARYSCNTCTQNVVFMQMNINDFKLSYGKNWQKEYEQYLIRRKKVVRKKRMKENVVKKRLRYFITITFKPSKAREKRNNNALRQFLKSHYVDYYLITEKHESGFIHYHGFVSLPEEDLIIKKTTQYGYIYTTEYFEKTCGFTYITRLNDNKLSRVVNYCSKYMTKENVHERSVTNNKSNLNLYYQKEIEKRFKNLLTYV